MTREELAATYAAPGRHYHNLAHIEDCLTALARGKSFAARARNPVRGDLVA
jgi:predicted metal-dependent HD superfamily phosphohydrolase